MRWQHRRVRPARSGLLAALLLQLFLQGAPYADETPPEATPIFRDAEFGTRRHLTLNPPWLVWNLVRPALHVEGASSAKDPPSLSIQASPYSLGFRYLRLAVVGEYRPGLLPFIGTSTVSMGGLRLRF